MDFTFGIITDGKNDVRIHQIIDTIEAEKIPHYEIVIVGNSTVGRARTSIIPFDESVKQAWITRKKNLVTSAAKYDNIVYLHDYVKLLPGWYGGFGHHGPEFHVCMNPIQNIDRTRYRDWSLWPGDIPDLNAKAGVNLDSHDCILPYDLTNLSKWMYISGAYFVAKKYVMQEFVFDENLSWGQGEDVYWSEAVKRKYHFSMNVHSVVQLMKGGKNIVFRPIPPAAEFILRTFKG